jgi:hypothetical protein
VSERALVEMKRVKGMKTGRTPATAAAATTGRRARGTIPSAASPSNATSANGER